MSSDENVDRWIIDLAASTARLGGVTVKFAESGGGKFTATLEGVEDENFHLRLNLFSQASEAFENAWFQASQIQST